MLHLACVDGGLLCGPLLVWLAAAALGWLGFRCCKGARCEDNCHEHPDREMSH